MFHISIWYDKDDFIEGIEIKFINYNKVFGYEL